MRMMPRAPDVDVPPRQSAHAPRVGFGRRLLGPLHFTGSFWYRFHVLGARVAPDWLKRLLMPCFATLFLLFLGGVRRASGRNLDLVLGECGWWRRQARAWKLVWHYSWCLTERYESLLDRFHFEFEVEGLEHWTLLNTKPSGFMIVTAHVGNWEIASRIPSGPEQRTMHLAREEEIDPAAQKYFQELLDSRGGSKLQTHFLGDGLGHGVELLHALQVGDVVALQCDRPRQSSAVVEIPFFGTSFPMPEGPAALARAAEVPILPMFAFREGRRRYRIFFKPPIFVPRTQNRAADVCKTIDVLGEHLVWAIGREPYQWHCFVDVRDPRSRSARSEAQSLKLSLPVSQNSPFDAGPISKE